MTDKTSHSLAVLVKTETHNSTKINFFSQNHGKPTKQHPFWIMSTQYTENGSQNISQLSHAGGERDTRLNTPQTKDHAYNR